MVWATQPTNQETVYNRTATYDISALHGTAALSYALVGAPASFSINDAGVITYLGGEANPQKISTFVVEAYPLAAQGGVAEVSDAFNWYLDLPTAASVSQDPFGFINNFEGVLYAQGGVVAQEGDTWEVVSFPADWTITINSDGTHEVIKPTGATGTINFRHFNRASGVVTAFTDSSGNTAPSPEDVLGNLGQAFTDPNISADYDITPTAYSVSGGTLPSGVSLDALTGALTGTPDFVGQYLTFIQATDARGDIDVVRLAWSIGIQASASASFSASATASASVDAASDITFTGSADVGLGSVGSASVAFTTSGVGTASIAGSDGATFSTSGLMSAAVDGSVSLTFTPTAGAVSAAADGASDITFTPTGTLTDLLAGTGGGSSIVFNSSALSASAAVDGGSNVDLAASALSASAAISGSNNMTLSASGLMDAAIDGAGDIAFTPTGDLTPAPSDIIASASVDFATSALSASVAIDGTSSVDLSGSGSASADASAANNVTFSATGTISTIVNIDGSSTIDLNPGAGALTASIDSQDGFTFSPTADISSIVDIVGSSDVQFTVAPADIVSPVLAGISVSDITTVTADFGVTTDESGGTLYYIVDTNNSSIPATVIAGTGVVSGNSPVVATGAQIFDNVALPAGTYYVHMLQADASGNNSSVVTAGPFTITGIDVVAPAYAVAPFVNTTTPDGAVIAATASDNIDANSTRYFVVVPDGAAAPSVAEVVAGTASGGGAALSNGAVTQANGFQSLVTLTGLAALTAYDHYEVLGDTAGNYSTVSLVNFTTVSSDMDTPTYGVAPNITSTTSGETVANATASDPTTLSTNHAMVAVPVGDVPTGIQIHAGQQSSGAAADASASALAIVDGVSQTLTLTGLNPSTLATPQQYDIWYSVHDGAGNYNNVLISTITMMRRVAYVGDSVSGGEAVKDGDNGFSELPSTNVDVAVLDATTLAVLLGYSTYTTDALAEVGVDVASLAPVGTTVQLMGRLTSDNTKVGTNVFVVTEV